MFVGLRVPTPFGVPECLIISDDEAKVQEIVKLVSEKHPDEAYHVVETENDVLSFSRAFLSDVAAEYEIMCLRDHIRDILSTSGYSFPEEGNLLLSDVFLLNEMAAQAYSSMMEDGLSEYSAVEEAINNHKKDLERYF